MAHPEDNQGVNALISEIRAYEKAQEAAVWKPQLDAAKAELDSVSKQYSDHMATHNTPEPEKPAGLTKGRANIGIQVFPDRLDLSYGKDLAGTKNMLKNLGIKRVRGYMGPGITQTVIDWYNACFDELGVELCATVGKPREPMTAAQWDATTTRLNKLRGCKILCNWNEPNHNRNNAGPPLTGWQAMTINHGVELKKRYNANYEIGSAQLWSGSLTTHDNDLKSLAAASGGGGAKYKDTFETIVWHLYQPGLTPFNRYKTLYTQLFGQRPIICSETGMSTAPNQAQGAISMDEAGQAKYIVEHCTMYLNQGAKVYWFELRDEYDPDGTDREDWLGIYRHDGTAKPAVGALKTLLAT